MTATTRRPAHAHGENDRVEGDRVVRFDRPERIVHWVSAAAVLVAVATGAILYVEPLAVAVGRRALVKDLHVVAGFAAVVPFLVVLSGPWRAGLQRDVRRFSLWHDDDVRFLRRRTRPGSETGKFNGGQKLNAVLVGSALAVMVMTGSVMKWFGPFPLEWRSGATFVHDWVSFGLWFLIPAHIIKAITTPGAVKSMWTGWVGREEAEARPRWWESITDRVDESDRR
ncbi:cytochrome b/b6 domain-containing protein [Actinospongicola halichondriae]|uniref:cytochrome b/b6 domain-containing protein n=1 Tax=Actinospongicola halichondriae TaxID=3236844 RepID=UPI003D402A54